MQQHATRELKGIVRPVGSAVRRFFDTPGLRYVCGTSEIAHHPRARYIAAVADTGQIVALGSLVYGEPGDAAALAVVVAGRCSRLQLEQLLHAAARDDGLTSRLATCFVWGDEPDRETLERAGLSVVACASCEGISNVILEVAPASHP